MDLLREWRDMGAPRACAERGKYHGPCIGGMWDVTRRWWRRGQGRVGHGMAWHGMAAEERIDLVLARRTMVHGEVSRT